MDKSSLSIGRVNICIVSLGEEEYRYEWTLILFCIVLYCIVLFVSIDICIVSIGEEEYKYEWTLISHPEGSEIGNMLGKNTATLKLTGVGTYTHSFPLGHSNLITCLTSFFWKKNPVRKKSHLWCLTDESGFEIFCQTPKKKKEKKPCKF